MKLSQSGKFQLLIKTVELLKLQYLSASKNQKINDIENSKSLLLVISLVLKKALKVSS